MTLLSVFIAALLASTHVVAPPPDVPASLAVKPGSPIVAAMHGAGDQIYSCAADAAGQYAWVLKAPDARLVDAGGKLWARHFAGPTWEANDKSQVQAKPAARVNAPDKLSVPWLLLNASSHAGVGVLGSVTQIQRVHTEGGQPPASGCDASHAGAETRVPYQADYYFYAAPRP